MTVEPTSSHDPLDPPFETSLDLTTFALSTAVYAERTDGSILLLQRAEGTAMAGTWFLPGGLVDPGEEPFAAAARELREETGLELGAPLRMVGCYPMWIYGRDMLQLTFRGRVQGGDETVISTEHTAHRWIDPEQFAAQFDAEAVTALAAGDDRVRRLLQAIRTDAERYLSQRGV